MNDGKTHAWHSSNTKHEQRFVYHYGWARKPGPFAKKQNRIERMYKALWGDSFTLSGFDPNSFVYEPIDYGVPDPGGHPRIMQNWIAGRCTS